ncbi:hypothetical protein [Novosphingobium aquae]|jgi:hypothetical protein|uniref:Uncharacterized protein n=1 Tax=Novosphingobium aquae TaxID=3133435 RepID=A0ABU8S8C7_9SPHN
MRSLVRAFSKIAPALAPALLLAGCGGAGNSVKSVSTASLPIPPTVTRPGPARPAIRPRVMAGPGLEGVIGGNAGDLQRQFGAARLDVIEGDARKLQFSGNACVLDVFLYPETVGREPTATYVEARRSSDGKDVDRASCVAALRKR